MFVITNREIVDGEEGIKMFGPRPNLRGPNELRAAEVTGRPGRWSVEIIPDLLTREQKVSIGRDPQEECFGSRYVAANVLARARRDKRNVLFFVHGYNNDIGDVLERAWNLEHLYGLEVIAFTWPADGGGAPGAIKYKADKRDAKLSTGALDRALAKMANYLEEDLAHQREEIRQRAEAKHPDNATARDETIARFTDRECKLKVSMLAHSMGNYLYKHLLLSTASEGNRLLFDNVVLACADANNFEHRIWVDRIRCRNRVYVTINERDHALALSRMKTGEEQLPRLGHYPFRLDSEIAVYVDFTGVPHVATSHSYFEGGPAKKNRRVAAFFRRALGGEVAESTLDYRADRNVYSF